LWLRLHCLFYCSPVSSPASTSRSPCGLRSVMNAKLQIVNWGLPATSRTARCLSWQICAVNPASSGLAGLVMLRRRHPQDRMTPWASEARRFAGGGRSAAAEVKGAAFSRRAIRSGNITIFPGSESRPDVRQARAIAARASRWGGGSQRRSLPDPSRAARSSAA